MHLDGRPLRRLFLSAGTVGLLALAVVGGYLFVAQPPRLAATAKVTAPAPESRPLCTGAPPAAGSTALACKLHVLRSAGAARR